MHELCMDGFQPVHSIAGWESEGRGQLRGGAAGCIKIMALLHLNSMMSQNSLKMWPRPTPILSTVKIKGIGFWQYCRKLEIGLVEWTQSN